MLRKTKKYVKIRYVTNNARIAPSSAKATAGQAIG
jgi:hypothetical protein